MSLYLAIFGEDDEEIAGVEVGRYSDFDAFRQTIIDRLENCIPGSRFPTLIQHSDCDGSWEPGEAAALVRELETIETELKTLPAEPLREDGWQHDVKRALGLRLDTLADCFFDVDGEPLLQRLLGLARESEQRALPILFQ
jgi:hypothetical protein